MNKTIIININGVVFHIEEDAYEILKSYMTEVKRHFAYSSDSEEIVTDIENRLAEMFNERLADQKKQVIVNADVEDVLRVMGSVSDFELPEEDKGFSRESYAGFKAERKLFRDIDDKVIAGVCAGLAHYFDIEVKWVRVLTVVIAAITGVTIPLYIILWIVLPGALTRQEKMAMKGEAINLQNFKRSFDEEVEELRNNPDRNDRATGSTRSSFDEILLLIAKILKIIVKAIGGIIILLGALALLSLIIALAIIMGSDVQPFPLNVINPEFRSPLYLSAFLILIIPLTALILFAARVLFNRTIATRTGSFAMPILWLCGLGMGIYYGSRIAADFREDAKFEQQTVLPRYKTLYLHLNPNKSLSQEDSIRLKLDDENFKGNILNDDDDDDFRRETRFELRIEKTEDENISVIKQFSGRGKNFESALKNAQRSKYQVEQRDSSLSFDKYLTLPGNALYRGQKVKVTLRVPPDTHLIIDGRLNEHLRDHNLWYCQPEDSPYDTPSEWIMTGTGLKCADDSLFSRKQHL